MAGPGPLEDHGSVSAAAGPVLSIIVPIAPGDLAWSGLLPQLLPLPPDCELLLVTATGGDGMERNAPVAAPAPERTRWLHATLGRASQQNAGAAQASGALLWFLHCDSRPDARAVGTARALDSRFDALGWFALSFHDGGMAHRLNAWGATLRARGGLPFGDQGLLLPAARFRALGGFDPSLPRGEDLDLVVRARSAGLRLQQLPGTVATSARRYHARGWWRTTAEHLGLTWSLARAARQRVREAP